MAINMTATQQASIFTALLGIAPIIASSAAAQTTGCEPVAQRSGREFGCFITARRELGALPRDSALYWHLDAFDTPAAAEQRRLGAAAWCNPSAVNGLLEPVPCRWSTQIVTRRFTWKACSNRE